MQTATPRRLACPGWLAGGTGIPAVLAFFQGIAEWKANSFAVKGLMEGANKVVAETEADFAIGDGRRLADQELHLWTFNEAGKVTGFRHYVHTAKHIAAAQG